jgi:hypothetical protein
LDAAARAVDGRVAPLAVASVQHPRERHRLHRRRRVPRHLNNRLAVRAVADEVVVAVVLAALHRRTRRLPRNQASIARRSPVATASRS